MQWINLQMSTFLSFRTSYDKHWDSSFSHQLEIESVQLFSKSPSFTHLKASCLEVCLIHFITSLSFTNIIYFCFCNFIQNKRVFHCFHPRFIHTLWYNMKAHTYSIIDLIRSLLHIYSQYTHWWALFIHVSYPKALVKVTVTQCQSQYVLMSCSTISS